jgi:hypothetical protein
LDPRKSEGDENDIFLRILFPGEKIFAEKKIIS